MNSRQLRNQCTLEAVASLPNLFLAAARARRGKSRRTDVEDWWLRREVELLSLRDELLSGAYQPGAYRFFEIYEPKRRVIAAAPFRDRVIHHALGNLLAPVLERRFIARSFSCQVGKGTTAARECCRRLTNSHRYVLKCDVRKFFPNVDHGVLFEKLAGEVRCAGVLRLVERIMASYATGGDVPAPLFPGDDLAEVASRVRGLPIGNLTSQLWANFYLDGLDHWMTETERHGAYLRYTDDFLVFGDDKARLWELRAGIVSQLAAVRLKLAQPKSRLLATGEGVPFCGFRFLPALRPRILGATKRRFERRRYALARMRPAHTGLARRDTGDPSGLPPRPADIPSRTEREGGEPVAHRMDPFLGRGNPRPGISKLTQCVFAWYQFSREGNSIGLRRAYTRWSLDARLKRRRRKTARVVRGGSWNNDNPDNFRAANRNNNHPDNRNDNNGFRCVGDGAGGCSPKAGTLGEMRGGYLLPRQSQEASLTAVPAPVGQSGKDAARAVGGNLPAAGESHGPQLRASTDHIEP